MPLECLLPDAQGIQELQEFVDLTVDIVAVWRGLRVSASARRQAHNQKVPCQKGGQVGENVRRLTPPGRQYQRFPVTAPIEVRKANAGNFNIVRFWRLGFCERGARSSIADRQKRSSRSGIVSALSLSLHSRHYAIESV